MSSSLISYDCGGTIFQSSPKCLLRAAESSGRTLPACVIVATTLCNFDATMKLAEVRLYVRCGATGEVTPICSVERGPIGRCVRLRVAPYAAADREYDAPV